MNQAKGKQFTTAPIRSDFDRGVLISAGMGDLNLQQAPSHLYGTPVSTLNPPEASEAAAQQAAQLGADLGAAERLQTRHNIRTLGEAKVLPVIKPRRPTV